MMSIFRDDDIDLGPDASALLALSSLPSTSKVHSSNSRESLLSSHRTSKTLVAFKIHLLGENVWLSKASFTNYLGCV